jgi:Flp pilus assembly pilin Flp
MGMGGFLMFAKLWNDEAGVISVEYLFLVTIVGLGLVIGFSNLEGAINTEYTELANAILALSQGYEVTTQSGCKASKQGSRATDTPGNATFSASAPLAVTTAPKVVDVSFCGTP